MGQIFSFHLTCSLSLSRLAAMSLVVSDRTLPVWTGVQWPARADDPFPLRFQGSYSDSQPGMGY